MISVDQARKILPLAGLTDAQANTLSEAMPEFNIFSPFDCAAFLANVGHETAQLTRLSENLNYSAEGLLKTWPSRFNSAKAAELAHRPEAIANFVYANRFGNGDEKSGDGWRYRGGGGLQLTFHDNYADGAAFFAMPVPRFADWVRTFEGAVRSAGWFWWRNNVSRRAALKDFDGCCDLVNLGRKTEKVGDSIGYAHRLELFNNALKVLS